MMTNRAMAPMGLLLATMSAMAGSTWTAAKEVVDEAATVIGAAVGRTKVALGATDMNAEADATKNKRKETRV